MGTLRIDPVTGCLCECPEGACPESGNGTYGSPTAFADLNYNEWYIRTVSSLSGGAGPSMYFLKPQSTANLGGGCSSPSYAYRVIEEAGPDLCTSGSYGHPKCQYRVKLEDAGDCDWDARLFLTRLMTGKIKVDYAVGSSSCGRYTIFHHNLVGPGGTDRTSLPAKDNYGVYHIGNSGSDDNDVSFAGCCSGGPIWNLGTKTSTVAASGTFSGTTFDSGFAIEVDAPSYVQDQPTTFLAVSTGPNTADSTDLWRPGIYADILIGAPLQQMICKVRAAETGTYKLKVWAGCFSLGVFNATITVGKVSMDISAKIGSGAYTTMITNFEPQPTWTPSTGDPTIDNYAGPTGTVGGPDVAGNELTTGGPWAEESSGTLSLTAGDIVTVKCERASKWATWNPGGSATYRDLWREKALSAVGLIKQ